MKPLLLHTSALCVIRMTTKKQCRLQLTLQGIRIQSGVWQEASLERSWELRPYLFPGLEALKEKEKLEEIVGPLLEKYFQVSGTTLRS